VEVFGDFVDAGDVRHSQTPAGPAVTTAHWGEYSEMAGAYAALGRWCAANGRQQTGTSWEVYGDAADDPQQRRTDIYLLLTRVS
jgi:effector-binding domain-containing protein